MYASADRGCRWRRTSETVLRSACSWNMPAARPLRKLWAPTRSMATPASARVARDSRANSCVVGAAARSKPARRSSNSHRPNSGKQCAGTAAA
jgi:hypothetical protein